MSTDDGHKGRSLGIIWRGSLAGPLGGRLRPATPATRPTAGSKLAGASSSAASLQVLSQQLAVQGREAVGGTPRPSPRSRRPRRRSTPTSPACSDGYGDQAGVSGPIEHGHRHLGPAGQERRPGDRQPRRRSLDLAGNADSFTAKVPQLQAQLDEVVRAMSAGGAPSSQVYIALRQVVLARPMAQPRHRRSAPAARRLARRRRARARRRRVRATCSRACATAAPANVQHARPTAPRSPRSNQAERLWTDMKKDLDAILAGSQQPVRRAVRGRRDHQRFRRAARRQQEPVRRA